MVNLTPNTNIFTQPQPIGVGDLISLIRLQNEQAADTKARAMPGSPGASGPGTSEAPSESTFPRIVGGASAGATGASSDVMNAVHSAWSNQGASPHAIAGVMANIADESGFNPTLRHADQPAYGGEAHYAHGLYQEGGAEYNNYAKWLQQNHPGADWRDPGMQSQFAAYRLRTGYPSTWRKMNNAKTPGEAASIYVNEYLKPADRFRTARSNKYQRGVPGLDAWMAKANVSRAKAEDEQQPIKRFAQGGIVTEPTLAMIGENGPEAVVPLYNKDPNAGPKVWTQTAEQQRPVINVPRDPDAWIFDYPNRTPSPAAKEQPEERATDPKDEWIFDYPNRKTKQVAGDTFAERWPADPPPSTGKKVLNWVRENPGHAALAAQLATIAPPLLGGALYYGARPLSYIARNPWQAAGYAAAGSEIAHILAGGTGSTTAKHVISTIEELMHAAGH